MYPVTPTVVATIGSVSTTSHSSVGNSPIAVTRCSYVGHQPSEDPSLSEIGSIAASIVNWIQYWSILLVLLILGIYLPLQLEVFGFVLLSLSLSYTHISLELNLIVRLIHLTDYLLNKYIHSSLNLFNCCFNSTRVTGFSMNPSAPCLTTPDLSSPYAVTIRIFDF